MTIEEEVPEDNGYGFCPDCGYALTNSGAVSHGDGDMADEIVCDACQEVKYEIHAEYCECSDCMEGISKEHRIYNPMI